MPSVSEFVQCDPRNYTRGRGGNPVNTVVVHYTGTNASAHNNLLYFSRNSAGASAHYFIDRDGTLCQSVSESDTAWHAGSWQTNQHSVGIECVSAGEDFTEEQVATLGELVRDLMARYGIPEGSVIRHYDVTGKLCPAPYVDASKWAALKSRILGGSAELAPTPAPAQPGGVPSGCINPPESILAYDGYFGPLTVKYVQRRMKAAGWYLTCPQGRLLVDGDFGYWTRYHLQKYLRYVCGTYQRNCDGDFGYYSVCALQRHLANVGCYWKSGYGVCDVDGEWGELTTVGIQRAVNAGVL